MVRRAALGVMVVGGFFMLPGARGAAADDKSGGATEPAASVTTVAMVVDAMQDGKNTSSPGGHELHWSVAKCPYKIQFKGQVQVDKPTKITYRWEWSDGTMMPTRTLDVKTAGTMVDVSPPDVWNVGKRGQGFRGVEIFHVLTPNDMATSTPVKVECGG
jgi:hypothetical protein